MRKMRFQVLAPMVVKSRNALSTLAPLEPAVDPLFHADSYGYRPGKSALDANALSTLAPVGQARQRCWRYDWVLDLDIKGFFDNIPQDLLMRAVKKHAKEQWNALSSSCANDSLHRAVAESECAFNSCATSARGGWPVGSA